MNLPGSAIGRVQAHGRPAGGPTGWNLPAWSLSTMAASMSWLATPPSRKPRVLSAGKRAAAMAAARTTPLAAR